MLEDLSFCDRERALLSVIIKTVLTFAVVNTQKKAEVQFKGAVSRNSAKSGYCKMLVELKET